MKNSKINYLYSILVATMLFVLFVVFNNVSIKALQFTYTGGTKEASSDGVVVNKFTYGYKIRLEDSDELIKDGDKVLKNIDIYAGEKVTVEIKHVANGFLNKNYDYTYVYRYNEYLGTFDKIGSYEDKEETRVLSEKGLYKVIYNYAEKTLTYVHYILVYPEMYELSVSGNTKYDYTSVLGEFNFDLKMKDGYDLSANEYYYAFGVDDSNLEYTKIDKSVIFGAKTGVNTIDKNLSVDVLAKYTSEDKQKFFFKVVRTTNGNTSNFVVSTDKGYRVTDSVEAYVTVRDEFGNILEDKSYYKSKDVIYYVIKFNTLVSYTDLQYYISPTADYHSISDCSEPVDTIEINHVVGTGILIGYTGNEFGLKTKDSTKAIVVVNGDNVNVVLNKEKLAIIVIDKDAPKISKIDSPTLEYKKDYTLSLTVEEGRSGIKSVKYYVDTCKLISDGECKDKFNENHSAIKEGNYVGAVNYKDFTYKLGINNNFGRFNEVELTLYIRVEDNAGNITTLVKKGYLLDNVIVTSGEDSLFIEKDIENGKTLLVKVLDEYKVTSVKYRKGDSLQACEITTSEVEGVRLYKCYSVTYDFRSKFKVVIYDELGNHEEYVKDFKYSTLENGEFNVDNLYFDVVKDGDYEIRTQTHNIVKEGENINKVKFSSKTINKLDEKLNINNLPSVTNLKKDLVMFDGENAIVLIENIIGEFEFPTLLQLLDKVKHLDEYKACGIIDSKCDINVYLRYTYKIDEIDQERLVEITFLDNTVKYSIEDFKTSSKISVNEEYEMFEYKLVDQLNNTIDSGNVSEEVIITFVSKEGVESTVNSIDTSKLGVYYVTQSFAYGGVSSYPLEYSIEIVDEEAPVIRLLGDDKIKIKVGETLDHSQIIKVIDNYDSDLTIQHSYSSDFDPNKRGEYIISYWAVDSSGNKSEVVEVTVIVDESQDVMAYLICGGIVAIVIIIMVISIVIEVRKSRKRILNQ